MENTITPFPENGDLDQAVKNLQEEKENVKLPIAYLLWLTWRSKFLDELCKDIDILHKWKEFEETMKQEIERDYLEKGGN